MNRQLTGLLLIVSFVALVNASSIINSKLYQAEIGQYRNTDQAGLEVRDNGNSPAGSNLNASGTSANCTENLALASAGVNASTSITAGDLVYSIRIIVRSSPAPPSDACFTATVAYNGNALAPLYIKTSSSPAAGDYAICLWDLNTTSMPALYTLKVSVQPYP